MTSRSVSSTTSAVISGSYGGTTRSSTLSVKPASPTPSDTVAITLAEYDARKQELRVEATSTRSDAVLKAYVTATGELIGTLSANGGTSRGQFSWPSNPQSITVRSSLGGSATATVALK